MDWLNIVEFFTGNQQQSKLFIICKLIIMISIFFPVILWYSKKSVNDETLNGTRNEEQQLTKLKELLFVDALLLVTIIFSGANLNYLVNPKLNSYLIGTNLSISFMVFSFSFMAIAWGYLLKGVKQSNKSAEEKIDFYLENNRGWNAGIAGLMLGLIGFLFFVMSMIQYFIPQTNSNDFHIMGLIEAILLFGIPVYLLVKIPKWFRRYVEKFI